MSDRKHIVKVRTLDGDEPHPDYRGWENFLLNHCEVRGVEQGVIFYGSSNCNYILFPCGTLIRNYGYHGRVLMGRVAEEGPASVMEGIRERCAEIKHLLSAPK